VRFRRNLLFVVAPLLALSACSSAGPTQQSQVGPDRSPTTSRGPATTALAPDPVPGIVYVAHAVAASIEADDEGQLVLVLEGTERRTEWLTAEASGMLPTASFVEQWRDLGLDADPPQAALIPASYTESPRVLVLQAPEWDEEARRLVYRATVPEEIDPRLEGMAPDPVGDPAGELTAVTLFISHPTGAEVPTSGPVPTTSTTIEDEATTTTGPSSTTTPPPSTTVVPPSSGLPATVPPPTVLPPTTPPTAPSTPPTPPPTRPPAGEPDIVADVTEVRLTSVVGSSTTFTVRNQGSGVGSWSAAVSRETGLSLAPSSGLLFPGKSTVIRVTFDGPGPNNDFADAIILTTAGGRTSIRVEVYPPG